MAIITENGLVLDTLTEYEEIARQEIRNKIPEADLSEGSDYDIEARILGADSWQHAQPIAIVLDQIFPATADTFYLKRHAEQRKIPWPDAAKATGYALLIGANGSTQANSSVATLASGIAYTTTAAATVATPVWVNKTVSFFDSVYPDQLVISDVLLMQVGDPFTLGGKTYVIKEVLSGSSILVYGKITTTPVKGDVVAPTAGVRAPISASEAGASGNANFKAVLTLAAPGAGITSAEVLELSAGADKPTDEEFSIYLQDIDAEYPAGGNRSQLLMWTKGFNTETKKFSVLGIARGFVYPVFRGLGTINCYPQGIKRARSLASAKITELQNFIAPAAPTEAQPGMVAPGADVVVDNINLSLVDVVVAVQGGQGYGPDWTGTFTVGAGSTTTRIVLTTDPTTKIVASNRVALRIGVNNDLTVATVDTVDAAGVNLTAALDAIPTAGETVYPGSNLIATVRDAVLTVFDDLGPGDTTPATRYPPPTLVYPANLDRALLIRAIRGVTGVVNLTLTTPALDLIAAAATQYKLDRLTITHL